MIDVERLKKYLIDKNILAHIPEKISPQYQIIAFKKSGNELSVGMMNPENLQIIDFIRRRTGFKITPYLISKKSLYNILKQYQESLEQEFGQIIKSETDELSKEALTVVAEEAEGAVAGAKDLEKIAQELPIVKIV